MGEGGWKSIVLGAPFSFKLPLVVWKAQVFLMKFQARRSFGEKKKLF
jgi:hypothetical protein